jgi:hypothetical protein
MVVGYKAAIGCGVSTGGAEDFGRAATWLAVRGLPALDSMLAALGAVDSERTDYGNACFDSRGAEWHSGGTGLSAALLGAAPAALFVSLAVENEGSRLHLFDVDVPLLQLPHFANAAVRHELPCRVVWHTQLSDARVACMPGEVTVSSGQVRFGGERALRMDVRLFSPGQDSQIAHRVLDTQREQEIYHHGYAVDDDGWARLCRYADNILVAATERSRALGAGAGLRDND